MNKMLAAFLIVVALSANAAHPLLVQLQRQLNEARALPVGTKTSYRCPDDLELLKGTPIAQVRTFLGKPDFEERKSMSFFLTSPVPLGQKGGGFPEITFHLTASDEIESATCYYAR